MESVFIANKISISDKMFWGAILRCPVDWGEWGGTRAALLDLNFIQIAGSLTIAPVSG